MLSRPTTEGNKSWTSLSKSNLNVSAPLYGALLALLISIFMSSIFIQVVKERLMKYLIAKLNKLLDRAVEGNSQAMVDELGNRECVNNCWHVCLRGSCYE